VKVVYRPIIYQCVLAIDRQTISHFANIPKYHSMLLQLIRLAHQVLMSSAVSQLLGNKTCNAVCLGTWSTD